MGLLKSAYILHHSPLPPFQFLCSTWNPVSSPRPTHVLRPTRTGPVKVGRRSALAARSVVSRPRLDRPEHGGHAGCSRDDDQRGALPSGADHRATTLYSVGPYRPDHDAVMRIGRETPRPRTPSRNRRQNPRLPRVSPPPDRPRAP